MLHLKFVWESYSDWASNTDFPYSEGKRQWRTPKEAVVWRHTFRIHGQNLAEKFLFFLQLVFFSEHKIFHESNTTVE